MPTHSGQERTEAATPKRREQARQEGQVARSRELGPALVFLTAVVMLYLIGSQICQSFINFTRGRLDNFDVMHWSDETFIRYFYEALSANFKLFIPFFTILMLVALAANLLQAGFVFSFKSLQPKLSRISLLQGFKQRFSINALFDLSKSLIKVGLIGIIVYVFVSNQISTIFQLGSHGVSDIVAYIGRNCLKLGMYTSFAIMAMAGFDYLLQRWQYERGLRMTRQEVKEERKQEEGDPQIRSRIRSIMRERAQSRMMDDVPKADIVVTNPTHIAVALRYQRDEMVAPIVVAKGAGFIAERIKAIARANDIFMVENKPVAQHLFKAVDVGEVIPEELYQAVAEILSYMYRIRPPFKTW